MTRRNEAKRPKMDFKVMNIIKNIDYVDETFDLVIDKSTLDGISCGERGSIDPVSMLDEVQRVLKTGGYYVIISLHDSEILNIHLNRDHLSFTCEPVKLDVMEEDSDSYYMHVCKKNWDANSKSQQNYVKVLQSFVYNEANKIWVYSPD